MLPLNISHKRIAITGGIGSGKSTIAKMLQIMGYPIFFADKEASLIMDSNTTVKESLIQLFGPGIYTPDGRLNRVEMAGIIFNNEQAKAKVNNIVHPAVWQRYTEWDMEQSSPITFMESAILHECGWSNRFDKTICITADLETRIQRCIERDKTDREKVIARINNQMSDSEKCSNSDYIIYTNENCSEIEQLLNTLEKIL